MLHAFEAVANHPAGSGNGQVLDDLLRKQRRAIFQILGLHFIRSHKAFQQSITAKLTVKEIENPLLVLDAFLENQDFLIIVAGFIMDEFTRYFSFLSRKII